MILRVAIVRGTMRLRHQDADVPADHLLRLVTEDLLDRVTHLLDDAVCVDRDDGIQHALEQGAQAHLARDQIPLDALGFPELCHVVASPGIRPNLPLFPQAIIRRSRDVPLERVIDLEGVPPSSE